jgi:hypothetical protein
LEEVATPGDFAASLVINSLVDCAVLAMRDLVVKHLESTVLKAVHTFCLAVGAVLIVVRRVKRLACTVAEIVRRVEVRGNR